MGGHAVQICMHTFVAFCMNNMSGKVFPDLFMIGLIHSLWLKLFVPGAFLSPADTCCHGADHDPQG